MDIDALCRRYEQARNDRANFDALFQDIADRVLPQAADFRVHRTEGEIRTERMFDSTAFLSAQRGLAAIASWYWPSNQRYQRLTTDSDELNKSQRVKTWMDNATDCLFRARYSPRTNFEAQMSEQGLSFFVFGTGVKFTQDSRELPQFHKQKPFILYKSLPLAQVYVQENASGRIDTLHNRFMWSLRQIDQRFPGKLPPKLVERMAKNPDEKIELAHTVCPREDYEPGRLGYKGLPWASCYYIPGEKAYLEEGGFHEWPFDVMRYMTATGETYGRSPAWAAMSNIRVLNTMKRTTLAAAQKVADPPLLASEDGVLGVFSQAPGAMNFGGLDSNGMELVKPLVTHADIGLSLEMMDKEREIIASAFFLDVFRALIENPQMTATQALELMQERATLMAPIGGRIESEGLGPMTERELAILTRAGALGPLPPELIEAQGQYKIEYTSPMRQAMRASEAIAITRTLEQVLPLAEADPSVLDAFESTAVIARELGEINGMPAKLLKSVEDIQAKAEERNQQSQVAAAVEAAPQISAAAANISKMQANGGRPVV
jgi:hypothetical protein